MSKLALVNRVPRTYDPASIQEIVRQIEQQGNQLAEGAIAARHGAMTAAPSAGVWVKGDLVDNSSPSVVSSAIADYVIVGWICTASGEPGTWKERRVLIEDITDTTNVPTLGTEVASTSGVSIDFTGIPSWVTEITACFYGVSTNGSDNLIIQLGDSGGIENTGYVSVASYIQHAQPLTVVNSTAGFVVTGAMATGEVLYGHIDFVRQDTTGVRWTSKGSLGDTDSTVNQNVSVGGKTLSAALDRIRFTTTGGTNTFDAGLINVLMR